MSQAHLANQILKQGPKGSSTRRCHPQVSLADRNGLLIRVLTAVYGLINAPATWRRTVRRVLLELGYSESIFDPCLYYLEFDESERSAGAHRGCAGVVLLDVDDFVQGGNRRHQALMETLKLRFRFGKWRTVFEGYGEYLGRTVHQMSACEIRVDMARYISEKLRVVTLPRQRLRDGDEAELNEHETSLLRGAAGSLLWVGKECRPDVGAACAMSMSWGSSKPRIKHIKAANKVISELQKTASVYLRVLPLDMDDAIWMSVSDASLANDDEKSQGGFAVCYVHKDIMAGKLSPLSLICWKSHKLRRTVKASLGSEALAWTMGWQSSNGCEQCMPKYAYQSLSDRYDEKWARPIRRDGSSI